VQPRREKHVCADEPHWSFMLFSWLTVSGYYLCFTIDNRERRPVQIEIEILPDQIEKHPDVCRPLQFFSIVHKTVCLPSALMSCGFWMIPTSHPYCTSDGPSRSASLTLPKRSPASSDAATATIGTPVARATSFSPPTTCPMTDSAQSGHVYAVEVHVVAERVMPNHCWFGPGNKNVHCPSSPLSKKMLRMNEPTLTRR